MRLFLMVDIAKSNDKTSSLREPPHKITVIGACASRDETTRKCNVEGGDGDAVKTCRANDAVILLSEAIQAKHVGERV